MRSDKGNILLVFLTLFALSEAQLWPTCNPDVVEWFPHPASCTEYIICFHGIRHIMPCAPGLHFNPNVLKCMLPDEAECELDYMCPPYDDPSNPSFVPDPDDCSIYYVCSEGRPIQRECSEGLWWDVNNNWCNWPEYVTCDNRTIITPPPVTTTTPMITTTTPSGQTTLRPDIESCFLRRDLFDGDRYLKTMCIFNVNQAHEPSRQRCLTANMNMFIIDSGETQTAFHAAATDALRPWANGFVWINGRRNVSINQWNVFNVDDTIRGPLYNGVDWVTSPIDGRNVGECLRYSSQHGPYQAMGVGCATTSWVTCEHYIQTTTPPPSTGPTTLPTTIPTTTTTPQLTTTTEDPNQPPNVAACWRREDLFHNGTYLKSSCIINTSHNYAAAENVCRSNNMQLFTITNSHVQVAFRESTARLLAQQQGGFVWINGRVDDDCGNWYVFDPTRRLMFSGVHWVQTDDGIQGRISGDCLRFSSQHTQEWMALGAACTTGSWLVCEFTN